MSGFGSEGYGTGPYGTGEDDGPPVVVVPVAAGPGRAYGASVAAADALLGIDFDLLTDLSPALRVVGGFRNLANAVARRLSTPRGSLFYDPDYGLDLREWLNADLTSPQMGTLAGQIELEVAKDERVRRAVATLSYNISTQRLGVTLALATAAGPFRLIIEASSLTVAVLDAGGIDSTAVASTASSSTSSSSTALATVFPSLTLAEPLGIDFDLAEDLSPALAVVGGLRNLANAMLRRFSTTRGSLFYDPDYGLDLREWLNADLTGPVAGTLAGQVELEALKDERVARAVASLTYNISTQRLGVTLALATAAGPFRLIIEASSLTVELLAAAAAET